MCLCVCVSVFLLSTYPCISVSTRLRINVFFVSTHPCTNESVHGSMNLAANRSIRQSPGHIYITIWRNEKIQEHWRPQIVIHGSYLPRRCVFQAKKFARMLSQELFGRSTRQPPSRVPMQTPLEPPAMQNRLSSTWCCKPISDQGLHSDCPTKPLNTSIPLLETFAPRLCPIYMGKWPHHWSKKMAL